MTWGSLASGARGSPASGVTPDAFLKGQDAYAPRNERQWINRQRGSREGSVDMAKVEGSVLGQPCFRGSPVSGAAMKGALMWQQAQGRCLCSLVPWVVPGSHEDATG